MIRIRLCFRHFFESRRVLIGGRRVDSSLVWLQTHSTAIHVFFILLGYGERIWLILTLTLTRTNMLLSSRHFVLCLTQSRICQSALVLGLLTPQIIYRTLKLLRRSFVERILTRSTVRIPFASDLFRINRTRLLRLQIDVGRSYQDFFHLLVIPFFFHLKRMTRIFTNWAITTRLYKEWCSILTLHSKLFQRLVCLFLDRTLIFKSLACLLEIGCNVLDQIVLGEFVFCLEIAKINQPS